KGQGDAVDQVLRQLGALNYPRFVLSCRVSDWRSATGLEAIREQYQPSGVLELHLNPLGPDDISRLLVDRVGEEPAVQIVEHYERLGLGGLLGNPQTLDMALEVFSRGQLADTKADL